MALLEIEALGVGRGGRTLLHDLTLNLTAGQAFGIAGATGAGKTTLALALAGLLPRGVRATGTVRFEGTVLPARDDVMARLRGQRIGFVFGDGRASLDPRRALAAQIGDADLLAEMGLNASRLPHQLSEPETRGALLAGALARGPDLLVADDPARDLDPVAARDLLDLLAALQRRRGFALLLLARDYRAVAHVCAEAMMLHDGRALEYGSAAELFGRPQTEATRTLIAAGRLRPRTLTRSPISTDFLTLREVSFRLPAGGSARIELAVRRGESAVVVAPPRAGKTRLARIVAGLERAAGGLLVLDHDSYHGHDLPPQRRREIGMVFSRPEQSFDPRLPVGHALGEPLRLEPHRTLEEQAERLVETVRDVGLGPELLRARPAALSHEQLYRLALARALMARPVLMVIDDPAAGFDPAQTRLLVDLIGRLRSDYSLTLFLTTTEPAIARALGDRVLVLHDGQIVESGSPSELADAPRHAFTQALVAARLPDVPAAAPPADPA